ncbi:MAG: hypothetical protein HPY71_01420 [Firmicutes bacterium]|nr:hypothetical protein [Bacillota bacterium]
MKNDSYLAGNLLKFDSFFQRICTEGCDMIKGFLNHEWYLQARAAAERVWSCKQTRFDIICFPYLWLCEDDMWDLVNSGLARVVKVTHKPEVLRDKLKSLVYGKTWNEAQNSAFELEVICTFARASVLSDIACKIKAKSGSNVDALIRLNQRDIYVEATRINRNLVDPDVRSGSMSVDDMIWQVTRKLLGKTKNGFQLGLVEGPSLLAIALPERGATQTTARWCMEENLESFSNVSAVSISTKGRFIGSKWYVNPASRWPLTLTEMEVLARILGSCPQTIDID